MAGTSVNMTLKNSSGKVNVRNVNYVNPNIADSDVAKFFASLNGLSTDELTKLEKVQKSDLALPTV